MRRAPALVIGLLLLTPPAHAACGPGRIVVANDEWTLSNTGFSAPSDSAVYAVNVAAYFTGGGPGRFRVHSSNFGLGQSSLRTAMEGAGHTWVVSTATPFTLAELLTYNGVFLCGMVSGAYPNNQVLIDYVAAGGCVYVCAGTSSNDPPGWNTLLNTYGLAYTNPFNNINGQLAIVSTHPVMQGVDTLFQSNGNSISDLDAGSLDNRVIATHTGGQGLYAVYESPPRCSGDLNADGQRNTLDLTRFLGQFGTTIPADTGADLNCDGAVNTLDLTRFLGSFGVPCP